MLSPVLWMRLSEPQAIIAHHCPIPVQPSYRFLKCVFGYLNARNKNQNKVLFLMLLGHPASLFQSLPASLLPSLTFNLWSFAYCTCLRIISYGSTCVLLNDLYLLTGMFKVCSFKCCWIILSFCRFRIPLNCSLLYEIISTISSVFYLIYLYVISHDVRFHYRFRLLLT